MTSFLKYTIFFLISFCFVSQSQSQTVTSPNNSGPGTLREAISNAATGATISIASSLLEITLDSKIDIQKNLTIMKSGGNRVKLNIGFKARIFDISNATVSFSNINFANGNTIDGGCIRLDNGVVNIDNCRFENSVASGTMGRGGAIFLRNGSQANISNSIFENNWSNSTGGAIADDSGPGIGLNIDNTQFINNRAGVSPSGAQPGSGGAIFIYGTSTSNISNSVFSENKAASEGAALWNSAGSMNISRTTIRQNTIEGMNNSRGGGGIYNNTGTLNIDQSSIIENNASGGVSGGGLSQGSEGTVNILKSTIAHNNSSNLGGGLYASAGAVHINACTISENSASSGGGLSMSSGLSIKNTIIFNNTAFMGANISGNISSEGYNLIGNSQGFTMNIENGDKLSSNPLLDALANNGGNTMTYALLPGSPAYNAGDPNDNFPDQIGQNVFGGRRDIGAYESQDFLSAIEDIGQIKFSIYPNPCVEFLKLDTTHEINRASIYGLNGKLCLAINQNTSLIDVSGLDAGLYLLVVDTADQQVKMTFVKD